MCIDLSAGDHVTVLQWQCSGSDGLNQQWLVNEHDGVVSLEPADVPDDDTIAGAFAATLDPSTGRIQVLAKSTAPILTRTSRSCWHLVQSFGKPRPTGSDWNAVAAGIVGLGGDGSGDYAFVGLRAHR
jgi:hypothetical protein